MRKLASSLQNFFANFFANMNKQRQNVLESLAPAAPKVERFIEVLKAQKEPKKLSSGDAVMFGDFFDDNEINAQQKGTVKVEMGSNLAGKRAQNNSSVAGHRRTK